MAYKQEPGRGKSTPLKMAGEKMKSTNPIMMKGDLDKDGKMSSYESKRQAAIDKAMADEKSPVTMYGSPVKIEGNRGPLTMYKSPVKMNGGPGDGDDDDDKKKKKKETVKIGGHEFETDKAEEIFTTKISLSREGYEIPVNPEDLLNPTEKKIKTLEGMDLTNDLKRQQALKNLKAKEAARKAKVAAQKAKREKTLKNIS